MIDLVRLGYAIAIAQRGSYAAAAMKLGISQPALSRSIQSLEREYDVRLFDRGRGGAKLTVAGEEFISTAQALVHRAASVDEQLRSLTSGRVTPISFGIGAISSATVLPGLLKRLVADGTVLRVRVESLNELQLLLRNGEIDFFISGLPTSDRMPHSSEDFRIKRIPLASLNLLVRPGHPLLSCELRSETIAQYRVASGSFLRELLSPARMARFGLQVPSVEIDDYSMLAALVRETDFILVGTRGLTRARPELGLVPLPIVLAVDDIEWGLVSSGQDTLSPAARRVAVQVLDALADVVRP